MKYKKIIGFMLLLLFLSCLSSCADKNITEPTEDINNIEGITEMIASTEPQNNNLTTKPTEPTESTTPEPIEIFQVPDILSDSIAANIKDITSGNVFGANFRRGVNMGNMLEASPDEGSWGVYFEPEYFKLIKQRGFDFVRLPVGWGNHIVIKGDTIIINKTFMNRVKYIVDEAVKNDLGIIVNIHHYNDMDDNPEKYAERLYQIWRIVSTSFQNYPANIVFEVFNEPHNALNTKTWNKYQNECVKIIRETNPIRKIVVTAGDWGGIGGIMDLMIPEDENLILSFHCYDPFNFTHQGADWTGGEMDKHLGTQWTGSDSEKKYLGNSFKFVKAWSEATGLPVLLGEFGAYSKADMESRVKWTNYMRETAEYYGFAWSYWEFCAGFGIYDPNDEEFFEDLANALTGTPVNESIYGTGTGMPKMTAERGLGYFGPFKTERNINIVCDSWTGMSLYDTENGTQIIDLGENSVVDWAHAFIILNGLTDTGEGFSHDKCELTFRNIGGLITDFCINLDNNGSSGNYIETQLTWMDEKTLKGNKKISKHEIIQNDDGTTKIIFDLQSAYRTLKNKCDDGIRIKMFIESVPDRTKNYDRLGSVEFIKMELK